MTRLAACLLTGLLAAGPAQAVVSLSNRGELVVNLKMSPPCCIVDGRSGLDRARRPLRNTVVWSQQLRINPTSPVVVIADDDAKALAIGRTIEKRFKAKEVLAVKGGFETWNAILSATGESGMPATFVIPMNTCEQGTPLQTLRSNKP